MSLRFLSFVLLGFSLSSGAEQWAHYRADAGGSAFSASDQIHPGNVSDLKVAWRYSTGDLLQYGEALAQTALEVTPILLPETAGQSLVLCTPFNRVIALDPESGQERWSFDPKIDASGSRPSKCRGVTWWQDTQLTEGQSCQHRIFSATHDRRLLALDAKTGKPCDDFGEQGLVKLYSDEEGFVPGDIASSSPPVVLGDVLIVGSAVVDFLRAHTPAGTVQAYDARTGEKRWHFDLIPKDSSDPAASSWPVNAHEVSGSANAWAPFSIDRDRDLVFIPTGAPSPDFYGALRPGNNRYANSVLALRASTGERVWDFQFVHHDLWDYDTPAQPLLIDLDYKGESYPALVQVTKQGFIFVLDRRNGKPIFPIEERAVSQQAVAGEWLSPTQPFPVLPAPIMPLKLSPDDAWGLTPFDRGACKKKIASLFSEGLFTPLQTTDTLMLPGSLGGANWGGAVYWPQKKMLFLNVNTMAFYGQLKETKQIESGGHLPPAGKRMSLTMQGTPYTVESAALVSPIGVPCTAPPWGKLMAIDLKDGAVRWQSPLGSVHEMGPVNLPFDINWGTPNLGGALISDGGLIFIGATMDKRFRAYDALTGEQLWSAKLPADAAASPMTYTLGGKQYVVIAAGGHHMFDRDMGDAIVAFALPDAAKSE